LGPALYRRGQVQSDGTYKKEPATGLRFCAWSCFPNQSLSPFLYMQIPFDQITDCDIVEPAGNT
jgi:hypothetical protein